MNQQHRDIITAIGRKQPISTAGIAEYLMDHFGYGGGMEFDAFRDQVSKTIGYLKNKGEIVGDDIPQAKGKPLRYWALANPQSECQSAEMASDVAEVEQPPASSPLVDFLTASGDFLRKKATIQESLTVAPQPVTVEVKAAHKPPLSAEQLIQGYKNAGSQGNMLVFAAGVAFAEKHHGIGQ